MSPVQGESPPVQFKEPYGNLDMCSDSAIPNSLVVGLTL